MMLGCYTAGCGRVITSLKRNDYLAGIKLRKPRCLSSHKVLVQTPKHWCLSTHVCWRDNLTVCLIRGAVQCLCCVTTAHKPKWH